MKLTEPMKCDRCGNRDLALREHCDSITCTWVLCEFCFSFIRRGHSRIRGEKP